ncbi:hypothetical protein [Sinorhizobium meliloti]|uniref:hypothetical protein n=1 Tax=Rhizobium meliloti TaxID=382 RepID=UPI0012BD455B|nr:hypothetical protein [Sinorhizobium meliloti]
MANEIVDVFNSVWEDGPASSPTEPDKRRIRQEVGPTIQTRVDEISSEVDGVRTLAVNGAQWKAPVAVATTGNVALFGEQTVDGFATGGSRILVKNQTNTAENGIYLTGAGAWTRVSDANAEAEIVGMAVFVRNGTVNRGKQFACTTRAPISVGTTAIVFQEVSDQSALNADIDELRETTPESLEAADFPPLTIADEHGFEVLVATSRGGIQTASAEINGPSSGTRALITDEHGFALLDIDPDEGYKLPGAAVKEDLEDRGAVMTFTDPLGFISAQIRSDGKPNLGLGSGEEGDAVANLNARCLAISAQTPAQYNSAVTRPVWNINHVVSYGQSLDRGSLAWPAIQTNQFGNLMLGDSVQNTNQQATDYPTFGSPVLKPLVATVTNGTTLYTAAEVSAFPPDQAAWGVTPTEAAIGFVKKLWLQGLGVQSDDSRVFVPTINSRGASQALVLQKGASPNYYGKIPDGAAKVKAAADDLSKSSGLAGIVYIQGEADYTANTDKATYKGRVLQIFSDIKSDAAAIYGAADPPAIFITQTGGSFTNDASQLAVGMAQIELADENRDVYLVGPNYFVPNRDDGHLLSNGSRWLGFLIGKVMHQVLIRGMGWRPLQPLAAELIDGSVHIGFHVPVAPLVWDTPYDGRTPVDFPGKGFDLYDDMGPVAFTPEIVADAVVRLTPARALTTGARVRYAGKATYNGAGCLRDSDPLTSSGLYEYLAGSGMQPDEDISELTGKPYPLHNWCCAFDIAIN